MQARGENLTDTHGTRSGPRSRAADSTGRAKRRPPPGSRILAALVIAGLVGGSVATGAHVVARAMPNSGAVGASLGAVVAKHSAQQLVSGHQLEPVLMIDGTPAVTMQPIQILSTPPAPAQTETSQPIQLLSASSASAQSETVAVAPAASAPYAKGERASSARDPHVRAPTAASQDANLPMAPTSATMTKPTNASVIPIASAAS